MEGKRCASSSSSSSSSSLLELVGVESLKRSLDISSSLLSPPDKAHLLGLVLDLKNKSTLFVMVADEAHWGITADGANASFVNDPALMACKNHYVLQVSATPYNLLTAQSRVPKESVIKWDEAKTADPEPEDEQFPLLQGLSLTTFLRALMRSQGVEYRGLKFYMQNCIDRYDVPRAEIKPEHKTVAALPKIRFDPFFEGVAAAFRKTKPKDIEEDRDDSAIQALLGDYAFNLLYYYHFFRPPAPSEHGIVAPATQRGIADAALQAKALDLFRDCVEQPVVPVLPEYLRRLNGVLNADLLDRNAFAAFCKRRLQVRAVPPWRWQIFAESILLLPGADRSS